MKKIGLIGGISWTSTLDYYRYLNEEVNRNLGGLNFAECIVYSINFSQFSANNSNYNWDANYEILLHAARQLEKAGAELIVVGANTAHIVADKLQQNIQLPLIHITDETAKAIKDKGLKKVALLGTIFTMELDFYKDRLLMHGIEALIPSDKSDREYIQQTIRDELGKGIIEPATKKEYLRIIGDLANQGAEGVILGCTEIPLLIRQEDVSVPVFDTTLIHSKAAVNFALNQ